MSNVNIPAHSVKSIVFVGVKALRSAFKLLSRVAGPAVMDSPQSRTFLRADETSTWFGASHAHVTLMTRVRSNSSIDTPPGEHVHDVPFARFKRIADLVTCDTIGVELSEDNNVLGVSALDQKGGLNATFKLASTPEASAPAIPTMEPFPYSQAWGVDSLELIRAVDQCIPSMGKPGRFDVDGIFIECGDDSVTLLATDRAKITRARMDASTEGYRPAKPMMIPRSGLKALSAFLANLDGSTARFAFESQPAKHCGIDITAQFIRFRSDNLELRIRLDDNASLPKFSEEEIFASPAVASITICDVKAFTKAVKAASHDGSVELSYDGERVLVSSGDGTETEVFPGRGNHSGESFARSLDGKALLAYLKSQAKSDRLTFGIAGYKGRRGEASGKSFDQFGPVSIVAENGAEFVMQPLDVEVYGDVEADLEPVSEAAPEPACDVEAAPTVETIVPAVEPVREPVKALPAWVDHVRIESYGRVTDYKRIGRSWHPSGNRFAPYMAIESQAAIEAMMATGNPLIVTPEPVEASPEPVVMERTIVRSAACSPEPTGPEVKPLDPVPGFSDPEPGIPASVNRIELLSTKGKSIGSIFNRTGEDWTHAHWGERVYGAIMNQHYGDGRVVLLLDPEPAPTDPTESEVKPITPVPGFSGARPKADRMAPLIPIIVAITETARRKGVYHALNAYDEEIAPNGSLKAALASFLKEFHPGGPRNAPLADRFKHFVGDCVRGCYVKFRDPNEATDPEPSPQRANAVCTPEPTPTGDIPRSVKRVELLDSRGYSQGDTYRRSAPGCWRHERLGCEMYVEMMNAYCHSGIVVFLPNLEPTDPPTDYGHKGLQDDSRAVDAAPVPDWLKVPTPNPFDEVEFAPECPAPISGGSPEAEPTPGEPIDHDTMLKLWLDSKATLVIDGISHRVFCYRGHGYSYSIVPDGTGIPDGPPTCTILCEVDHATTPPPLSGGSPELDAPPVPVFPDEDYDNGDRPDDDHDTPSSWDGIPEPIDPDATCLDIPITPDDDHEADEWALYDACESMIVAGSRRSRLAHVEDALRTILLHILETEVRIGQAARVTWKHRMSAERRDDFLEWVSAHGITIDPNGDAPTDPAEMFEWLCVECRDGSTVDFPEPTPTPDPDGDDDEATRSTLVLPDTAMACGDFLAQRSTPIGALTHDSVASLDEVRLPVPAGLHAGHAGQDHRAEESGPDRDGERPLPAPGGPGHRGPVPRLEAPAPAAGDVEAPDTLTCSSETSSNPFPAFLGGDDDDEAIGPGRRAGSGDQEPPTHGARHGVPAEPGPCRAAGPMDCGPRGDQGRPAGRHRPRSLRAPGPAGHDNASLTPDTLTIQGRLYGLATAPDGWDVCRTDGVSYRVTTGPLGLECDCPSFRFACQGIHGAACKHCVAIREAGLIPQAQPAPPLPGPGPEFFRNPCPAYIDAAAL